MVWQHEDSDHSAYQMWEITPLHSDEYKLICKASDKFSPTRHTILETPVRALER